MVLPSGRAMLKRSATLPDRRRPIAAAKDRGIAKRRSREPTDKSTLSHDNGTPKNAARALQSAVSTEGSSTNAAGSLVVIVRPPLTVATVLGMEVLVVSVVLVIVKLLLSLVVVLEVGVKVVTLVDAVLVRVVVLVLVVVFELMELAVMVVRLELVLEVSVEVSVAGRRYQEIELLLLPPTHVTLFSDTSVAAKPIMVMTPFVEMIGYLPRPSKFASPFSTVTACPMLLIQKPSKSSVRKSVMFDTVGVFCVTITPLTEMLPEATDAMPGTAATFETMLWPSEAEELSIDACASSRSASAARKTIAFTRTEPADSVT
jgi:hypothetical protein